MWFTKACERKCYIEHLSMNKLICCLTECMDKERDDFERAKEFERIKEDARRKEIEESFPFIPRSASR